MGKRKQEFPYFNEIYPTENFVQFTNFAESVSSSDILLCYQGNVQNTKLIRTKFDQWIDLENDFVNQESIFNRFKNNCLLKVRRNYYAID